MDQCLLKLKEHQAKKVFLVSNTKLNKAISMYKSYGFATTHLDSVSGYKRGNIIMEYPVENLFNY